MKLIIDTDAKTLKVEQPIKLVDFIEQIKTILPDWKDYELDYIGKDLYIPYYPQAPSFHQYTIQPIYMPDLPDFTVTCGCKND